MTRLLLAFLCVAAGSGRALAAEAPAAMPEWLEKGLAREAEAKPAQALTGVESSFKAQVAAKPAAAPVVAGDSQYVALDIGASAPMECWIYDEQKDPAQSLRGLAESSFKALEGKQGTIEAKLVQATDAGAVGGAPFLALDWIYRARQKDGARAGQLKQVIATKNERSIYCGHAELGYVRTFHRVFQGLVESIEFTKAAPAPYYTEIATTAIGGRRVGYVHQTFTRDADGDTRIVDQTTLLVPADAQSVKTQDNYRVQFSTADGRLLNEVAVEAEGETIVTNLTLQPGPDGIWKVAGTMKSKPFETSLGKAALKSDMGKMLALRELARAPKAGAELKLLDWTEEDPDQLHELAFKVDKAVDTGFEGSMTMSHLSMTVVVDGSGSVSAARMPIGATTLEIRRVYTSGAFEPPPAR